MRMNLLERARGGNNDLKRQEQYHNKLHKILPQSFLYDLENLIFWSHVHFLLEILQKNEDELTGEGEGRL